MNIKIVVAICLGIATAVASKRDIFFRRDYTYLEEYDAFYKLHWGDDTKIWKEAFLTCDDEGAELFYPADEDEWHVAANMSYSLDDLENIFIGVRDEFGFGDFLTADGRFIPEFSRTNSNQPESKCGVMSVKTGVYNVESCELRSPFICKKLNNEYCPTIDSGYIFLKSLKKCYKVHNNEKTWANAMHTCIMEGGVLSNSVTQADKDILRKLLIYEKLYFIGFKRMSSNSDFYSTQGKKIIASSQLDNNDCITFKLSASNYDNRELSPYVSRENCDTTHSFICEMEIHT